MPNNISKTTSEKLPVAFYNFSQWFTNETNYIDFRDLLDIPCEGKIVPYEEAEIIFIDYAGNADHIPFITSLFEKFPHKKFIVLSGEYLRRTQKLIPKKISTKATHALWAKKMFPYVYNISHSIFPRPTIQEDMPLYQLLYKHRYNKNVLSLLCEDAPELGESYIHFPLFLRKIISQNIPRAYREEDAHTMGYTRTERYTALKNNLKNITPNIYQDVYSDKQGDEEINNKKDIFCSSIFGNTTRERVLAIKSISKVKKVIVYGENPISVCGALKGDVDEVYSKSLYGICFENTSVAGYITEKLYNIIKNRAIPIYWGDTKITRYCNTDAMIYCASYKDIYSLHKRIKETHLKDISETPYFLDEHIAYFFEVYEQMTHRVQSFLCS